MMALPDDMSQSKHGATEWCLGMPLVERRSLMEDERKTMAQLAVQLKRRKGVVWTVYITSWIVFGGLLAISEKAVGINSDVVMSVCGIIALLLIFAGLPVTILVGRDCVRRGRMLAMDLADGSVDRYAGPLVWDTPENENLLALQKAKFLTVEPGTPWSAEVLHASRRIAKVDGRPTDGWIFAPSITVANAPAFVATELLQQVQSTEDADILTGERETTDAEAQELGRHARLAWTKMLPAVIGFNAYFLFLLTIVLTIGSINGPLGAIRFTFFALVTVVVDVSYVIRLRYSRQLYADQARRSVQMIQINDHTDGASHTVEILPVSSIVWTEDGVPAAWRKML